MGLGTARNRLGRVSHILVPLALKACQVVIVPPNKAL